MRTSMKQTLTALALSTGLASRAFAQVPAAAAPPPALAQATPAPTVATQAPRLSAYAGGDAVTSLAVALGGLNGSSGETVVPPLVAAFDYGVHPEISVGGIASYYKSAVNYGYAGLGGAKWTYSYLTVGVRSDYHFGRYVGVEKLDLYGGAVLAYGIVSVSAPASPYAVLNTSSANLFIWGLNLGARYFFTPAFAAQVELGVGLGNLSAGLAYKF